MEHVSKYDYLANNFACGIWVWNKQGVTNGVLLKDLKALLIPFCCFDFIMPLSHYLCSLSLTGQFLKQQVLLKDVSPTVAV